MLKVLITNYFLKGFYLANRSLDIYLLLVFLTLVAFLPSLLGQSIIGKILQFITIPLFLIQFGFWMSIPSFLVDKQQHKLINYRNLVIITLRNAKRLIVPSIILSILFGILALLLIFYAAFSYAKSGGDPSQIIRAIQNLTQSLLRWNPVFFIFPALFSFFVFTSIYFSLENKGFFGSVKRSVIFGFKNLNYIAIVFLIYAIFYSISSLFPPTFEVPLSAQTNLGLLIRGILGQYMFLIIVASSLLYYQSKVKEI
ncbi:MAG: hypothetical protein A3G66_01460 [Candidatus Levybacteria bacterium RIFCSPLOWO2_12_FULL_39_17]|nr:MAG: hypothetical protein A3G66_01460 [Candidatus Levybacteria bacterium RIFCSPLOWO2_12_FULL_39_17]